MHAPEIGGKSDYDESAIEHPAKMSDIARKASHRADIWKTPNRVTAPESP